MGLAARLLAGGTAGPAYDPGPADRHDVRIAGLDLPMRATVALVVVTLVVLVDYTRALVPAVQGLSGSFASFGSSAAQTLERVLLFGLVPWLVLAFGFRDRPSRYGLRLGDWRWGLGLLLLGLTIMTPIILALAARPEFISYYQAPSASGGVGGLLATNLLQLAPAEFLFRGFLMFTLLRRIGPIGVVVAQLPFVFAHLGKPELELYSTLFGGSVFGWLDWRTGSILWSALGHVYIVTLLVVAVGGAG